ncbi:membrane protein insertase YidC [Thaumasiovibrio sp. DFM-14]|uniref:membrane protein insertase YidC n=1 Tax=Thaumasiovibrio sp. DFM-14 TaxID=3384792 RepID=UPI0039A03D6C
MDSQRNILLIALLFVSFLLYQQWNVDSNPQPQGVAQTQISGDVPTQGDDASLANDGETSNQLITITTNALQLTIDTLGGDIIAADLLKYDAELESDDPFVLLQNSPSHSFVAQSGLIGSHGVDTNTGRAQYSVTQDAFTLTDGDNELRVPMSLTQNGITYTKTFIVQRDSYAVDVEYTIDNQSMDIANVQMYAQLRQDMENPDGKSRGMGMSAYRGAAYSSDDTKYKKYSFDDMAKRNLNMTITEGWAAMLQHYFTVAWIPRSEDSSNLFTRVANGQGYVGLRMPAISISPDSTATMTATLWAGPKLQKEMQAVAKNLDLTVDYGWLWFLASPIHKLLSFIQSIVVNWGLAIIVLTCMIRGAMYPLTKAQYTSMAKMRMLQPKLQEMRERFGDDRQRMSQAMMELYKEEKVNPLGGCLPILLQMPIFISFYWALMESVQLRHSEFFLWINDLSAQDPYYILPLLMGGSMFMIQKMSPTTVTDPMQQKIMTFMPVMFTFFFLWFPSGLVLYWLTSNIVTLIQQTLIYRALEKKGLHSSK